jgi:hypothetical protein
MGEDLHNFCHKSLVRRDLVVPILYKLPEYDRYKGIQLEIDIISARERG